MFPGSAPFRGGSSLGRPLGSARRRFQTSPLRRPLGEPAAAQEFVFLAGATPPAARRETRWPNSLPAPCACLTCGELPARGLAGCHRGNPRHRWRSTIRIAPAPSRSRADTAAHSSSSDGNASGRVGVPVCASAASYSSARRLAVTAAPVQLLTVCASTVRQQRIFKHKSVARCSSRRTTPK
jgi:hypothetical protein